MMRHVRLLFSPMIAVGFSMMLSSCVSWRITEDWRQFPRSPDYALKGQYDPEAMGGLVDTNCIYLVTLDAQTYGRTYYHWYRFWNDGHVIWRRGALAEKYPTPAHANSFENCNHGFYIVSNGNVYVELFLVGSPLEGGEYRISELVPVERGFRETRFFIRSLFHRNDEIGTRTGNRYRHQSLFQHVPMEGLVSQPDW